MRGKLWHWLRYGINCSNEQWNTRGEEAERQKSEIPEAPTVYCPKENKRVPIWYCLGSLTQGRESCPYLIKAIVHGGKWAKVECKFT